MPTTFYDHEGIAISPRANWMRSTVDQRIYFVSLHGDDGWGNYAFRCAVVDDFGDLVCIGEA